MKTSLSVNIS